MWKLCLNSKFAFLEKIYAWQTLSLFCHISNPISSFPLLFLWHLFKTLEIQSDHTTSRPEHSNRNQGIDCVDVGDSQNADFSNNYLFTVYLLLKFLFLILLCVLHLTCMHVCVLRVCLLTTEARQVISFSWFWVADSCELQQPWCENWILDPLAEHLPSLCSSPLVNNSC